MLGPSTGASLERRRGARSRRRDHKVWFLFFSALHCGALRLLRVIRLGREYVSVLEDVAWVMSELVKNSVPFAQRDRPARSLQPAADVPTAADTPDGNTARRTSRESRPTKRKLGPVGP